jgi:hypothetical protein
MARSRVVMHGIPLPDQQAVIRRRAFGGAQIRNDAEVTEWRDAVKRQRHGTWEAIQRDRTPPKRPDYSSDA